MISGLLMDFGFAPVLGAFTFGPSGGCSSVRTADALALLLALGAADASGWRSAGTFRLGAVIEEGMREQ